MALSGLNKNWENISYEGDRNEQIKTRENAPLKKGNLKDLDAHVDGSGKSIAMGYGYDLFQRIDHLETDLAGFVTSKVEGVSVASALSTVKELVQAFENGLYPNDIDTLEEDINSHITLSTQDNADLLLDFTVQKYFEEKLTDKLGIHDLDQSRERAAIINHLYRLGMDSSSSLMNAIRQDNRAEAWYEMRYNATFNAEPGDYTRVVEESNMFGLYSTGVDADEAKTIMKMYLLRKDEIEEEENESGALSSNAYTSGNSILSQISDAQSYLISDFNFGMSINGDVIVGNGLASYAYKEGANINDADLQGTEKNDLMFGEAGNDTISGGNGSDVIYGGDGNDTLYGGSDFVVDYESDILIGGEGFDTYYVGQGDIIIDSDGSGEIYYEGDYLGSLNFVQISGNSFVNESTGKAAYLNPVTGNLQFFGSYFEIHNFESGDFGITLQDNNSPLPTFAGVTQGSNNSDAYIVAGFTPGISANPVKDDNSNGLADSGIYAAYGNDGNDFILGEDSWLSVSEDSGPQDDWLYGGSGYDVLGGYAGDDYLDGGADGDSLYGHNGDDYLLGGAGGDVLSGDTGKDYLDGGDGDDALGGGGGDDIIVGGAGNDYIRGDYNFRNDYMERTSVVPLPFANESSFGVNLAIDSSWSGSYQYDPTTLMDFGGIDLINISLQGDTSIGEPDFNQDGNDFIFGGLGNDHIKGDKGNDKIFGEDDDDWLEGGDGDDSLFGGNGNDVCSGLMKPDTH